MAEVIWRAQPKQAAFMARPEWEALYGGAAGGGKSEALVMEALRQVKIPHYRALILRKTFPQLAELIDKSLRYYARAFPAAKYNDSKHAWTFPSGAKIRFGDLQYEQDKVKYQGQSFDFIAFDELTHFTWEEYSYLFSRCRPNGPGTRCYIRATANPGGVGHAWVKERFITAAPPMTTIWQEVEYRGPDGQVKRGRRSRVFVPARVTDNQKLLEHDPGYLLNLAALPQAQRAALLDGNWDSFSGQVFSEWRDDPAGYQSGRGTHVIDPFEVPGSWPIWRGFDWGYARPFSVGWYAVDGDRRLYRIRELYGCTGVPNEGVKWEPSRVAQEIRRIESEDPNLRGRTIHAVADPAIFASAGGESVGDIMARCQVYWDKGDHQRLPGKMQIHHRLAFDRRGVPMLYVFKTCRHFIRTVPALVYAPSDVEDVDTRGEDHIYDELRYVCMANPMAPRPRPRARPWSPLDSGDDAGGGHYDFYRRY